MLVEKSCVEILRSCGINILVVFSDIPEFCFDYKLPTTKNIELATKFWKKTPRFFGSAELFNHSARNNLQLLHVSSVFNALNLSGKQGP